MLPSSDTNDTPITSKADLIAYFNDGCKPKKDWLIGTEHEKFPFRLSDLRPVSYDEPKGIKDLLQVLKIFGWRETLENNLVIGLQRGGAHISLEPGGQLELSGRPVHDLHETAAEIDQHLEELEEVSRLLDIGFLGMGFHPTATRDELFWMPKERYAIMRDYLPQRGRHGIDMMLRTCTTQVNLDYADEADMIMKLRIALALQPVATALFAASPFAEGKQTQHQSWRMAMWQDTDADRCGTLPFVFEDGFGFERYVDYALNVPMLSIQRDGRYIHAAGQSFKDFIAGKLPARHGELPTIADWQRHLNSIFTDVRLKQYLEMRGADCGNAESILALPSFWTGLLYDDTARSAAWDLIQDWTPEERAALSLHAPQSGLRTVFRDRRLCDIAHKAITLAQQGLRRRAIRLHGGADETRYLDNLFLITETGMSYADNLASQLEHQWHGNIMKVFESCKL